MRDHLPASGEQDGEHRALVGAADGAGLAAFVDQLDGTQHTEAHVTTLGLASGSVRRTCDAVRSACDRPASAVVMVVPWPSTSSSPPVGGATSPWATRCCVATWPITPRSMRRSRSPAAGGRSMPTTSRWPISDDQAACSTVRSCSLRPRDWDDVLGRIGCFFRCGRGQARLWSAWPTPDLRDDGWRLSGHPPLLIRPPASTNPVTSPTSEPEVRSVSTVADLARWERVVIDGSPLPELQDAPAGGLAPAALLDDERLRFLVGLDGDRPVAAAVSFTSHGIGSLVLRRHAARRCGGAATGADSPSNVSAPHLTCG